MSMKFGRYDQKIASKNIRNWYSRPAFLGKNSLVEILVVNFVLSETNSTCVLF